MKHISKLFAVFILLGITSGCFNDKDDDGIFASEINDFVWKGMNVVYLYKDNVPDLSDDRFASDEEYGLVVGGIESAQLHASAASGNSPSLKLRTALMKLLNSGCPSRGFDVNSGWNWLARKNG